MPKIKLIALISLMCLIGYQITLLTMSGVPIDEHQTALGIYDLCQDKGGFLPTCYEDSIVETMEMNNLTMDQTFSLTKKVQSLDPGYFYCHVLSHRIAQAEVKKHPSSWTEVLKKCPSDMCSGGCIHGVFQERFNDTVLTTEQTQSIIPTLQEMCQARQGWQATELEKQGCNHAIGHATIYITGADMQKSVNICHEVAKQPEGDRYLQTCIEGLFMQVYQPQEPDDKALVIDIVPSKQNWKKFCSQFDSQTESLCLKEGWALFIEEIQTPEGIIDFCSYTKTPDEEELCYNRIANSLMTIFDLNMEKVLPICLKLPLKHQGNCIGDSALALMKTDYSLIEKTIEFCLEVKQFNFDQICFEKLATNASYSFGKNSTEYERLCSQIETLTNLKCR